MALGMGSSASANERINLAERISEAEVVVLVRSDAANPHTECYEHNRGV